MLCPKVSKSKTGDGRGGGDCVGVGGEEKEKSVLVGAVKQLSHCLCYLV